MIDIANYRLLTPALATLNAHKELTVYYRDGEIAKYLKDYATNIDLREVLGVQNEDFNLVFYNRDDEFIKECQKSPDWLQAIYNMFDFKTGAWVEVKELNQLEFLDVIYNQEEITAA